MKTETTLIEDGLSLDIVTRRSGPAVLNDMSADQRHSVRTYQAVAEAVLAGGASVPRDTLSNALTGGCTGGAPPREGRQAMRVEQVSFLRALEKAVGGGRVTLRRGNPSISVPVLDLWRSLILGNGGEGLSVSSYLAKSGLARSAARTKVLRDAMTSAAERVAAAIAETKNPLI